MISGEPLTTGWLLTIAGLLVLASVLFSRPSERIGFPAVLLFLGIGLLASLWLPPDFADHSLAFRIGTVGLVLILFDGGLNTSWRAARPQLAPAAVLATLGVVGTMAIVAVAARLLGLGWPEALLIGAIVSSTDAAAVFAALRGSNVQLRQRVGATLELESGLNDPMAVILTITLTGVLLDAGSFGWLSFITNIVLQLAVGLAAGLAIGWLGQQLLQRIRVPAAGLYPAMTLALAMLAFGIPTIFLGSGFLAVYVAALMLGNRRLPYRAGILRVHDALAWMGQITMFLVLGLLAVPKLLAASGLMGIALGLVLALLARPLVVALCLTPFRYEKRETAFIAWTGLRGAVPILLASYPVMRGVEGAIELFHLVFFIVVFNAVIPGATIRWMADRLKVERAGLPRPTPVLEITATENFPDRILSFYIDPAAIVAGSRVEDLPMPDGADILMLVRRGRILPVKGSTVLEVGDHVHLLTAPGQLNTLGLLFGLREED